MENEKKERLEENGNSKVESAEVESMDMFESVIENPATVAESESSGKHIAEESIDDLPDEEPEDSEDGAQSETVPAIDFSTIPPDKLANILESLIFVSAKPVPLSAFEDTFGNLSRNEIKNALKALAEKLESEERGIRLLESGEGYMFITAPCYSPFVQQYLKSKPRKLSRAAMETLAVIAYQQPCIRAEIEHIRGVDSGGVLKSLLDKKLIKVIGRREDVGRPLEYGTSKQFLSYFGLSSLKDMPTLREFEELVAEEQARQESELPAESDEAKDRLWDEALDQSYLEEADAELEKVADELLAMVETAKEVEEEVLNRVPDSEEDIPENEQPIFDLKRSENNAVVLAVPNEPATDDDMADDEEDEDDDDEFDDDEDEETEEEESEE